VFTQILHRVLKLRISQPDRSCFKDEKDVFSRELE